jgi:hypothetical protein
VSSTILNQIETATTLIWRLQQANDDGVMPIQTLRATIFETNNPAETRARNRTMLRVLAATARSLVEAIENEESHWEQSDKLFDILRSA